MTSESVNRRTDDTMNGSQNTTQKTKIYNPGMFCTNRK